MVNVTPPETGSMGNSHNKSVTFRNPVGSGVKEQLQKQMKEIEEKKSETERALKEAQAAASKKDGTKSVAITA
jgi:hypothetical protein